MFDNKMFATGMGSLPYTDVEQALEKVKQYFPFIPFWPQLPKRDKKELMLEAFLYPWVKEGLVKFEYGRGIFSEDANKDDKYIIALEQNELLPGNIAPGFYKFIEYLDKGFFSEAKAIKGQVTGPNTLCKYNSLTSGLPLNHSRNIVNAILELVDKQIKWQIELLKPQGLPVIICIDEPAGFPQFYEPCSEELEQGLIKIILNAKNQGALVGIHNCSKPDWYKLTKLPIDIISFDAFSEDIIGKDIKYVQEFVENQGKIAWGIIPTTGASWHLIEKRLEYYKPLISTGGLITPSCGLGITSEEVAEQVMILTQTTTHYINKN